MPGVTSERVPKKRRGIKAGRPKVNSGEVKSSKRPFQKRPERKLPHRERIDVGASSSRFIVESQLWKLVSLGTSQPDFGGEERSGQLHIRQAPARAHGRHRASSAARQ
jgi:hypothetical protein